MDLETRASYTKPAFEVLDLKNSFEASGLECGNPCFSNAVWRLLRLIYLASRIQTAGLKPDRGSKTRPRSDLRWLNLRLKFTTSIASAVQLLDRVLNLLHWSSPRLKFTSSAVSALTVLT